LAVNATLFHGSAPQKIHHPLGGINVFNIKVVVLLVETFAAIQGVMGAGIQLFPEQPGCFFGVRQPLLVRVTWYKCSNQYDATDDFCASCHWNILILFIINIGLYLFLEIRVPLSD
jgi:hypothetical protein